MTLKIDWEKTPNQTGIDETAITSMFKHAFGDKDLASYQVISDSCANLNFKLMVQNQENPLILRIYIRDKDSVYKEQKLAKLIKQKIPVPQTYFIGEFAGYNFALTEYMQGTTMRNLLLNMPDENSDEVVYEAGKMLSLISSFQFKSSGFFDNRLLSKLASGREFEGDLGSARTESSTQMYMRIPSTESTDKLPAEVELRKKSNEFNVLPSTDSSLEFALKTLQHQRAKEYLGLKQINLIADILNKYGAFFPDETHRCLVHGDYDPANILVDKIEGKWKITAILDWEFAFSGSWLCDISKMLRYAHKIPASFEDSFLKGVTDSGLILPDNWKITTYLLNILFLLDCLVRSEPNERPNQCADIKELISYFTNKLSESIVI